MWWRCRISTASSAGGSADPTTALPNWPTLHAINKPRRGRPGLGEPSESEIAQAGMVVRTASERPAVLAVGLFDGKIIDAGDAPPHQAMLVKFPVLIAVASKPEAAVIVPLIGE